jgi:hypothetical protein
MGSVVLWDFFVLEVGVGDDDDDDDDIGVLFCVSAENGGKRQESLFSE